MKEVSLFDAGEKMNQRLKESAHLILTNAVNHARDFVSRVVSEGDIVVDATTGNGYDTLFLAELVGESGRVFAFDIQSEALNVTRKRLEDAGVSKRVELILAGHQDMSNYVSKPLKAMMFNLGYLPGNPKGPVTKPDAVMEALKQGLKLLMKGGLVSIVAYPGHPAGREELTCLFEFLSGLCQKEFSVAHFHFINQQNNPSELMIIEKK